MKTTDILILALCLMLVGVLALTAQAPAPSETLLLKDQVQTLKEQLSAQVLETERCKAEASDWRARAQSMGVNAVNAELKSARKALDDELITALGGDPTKGDTLERTGPDSAGRSTYTLKKPNKTVP